MSDAAGSSMVSASILGASILGSGVAFPLRTGPHGAPALAHDEADVDQAIRIILGTARGERPMRPEFGCGVHECVFEQVDARTRGRIDHEVRAALDRWEPRVAVEDVRLEVDDGAVVVISIDYRIKATSGVRNLVHPFYLVPAEEERA